MSTSEEREILRLLNAAQREDDLRDFYLSARQASAIIQYRAKHKSFHSLNDLLKVPGVGPRTLSKIRYGVLSSKIDPTPSLDTENLSGVYHERTDFNKIDPTRYSDTKRVVSLLFAVLTGPGGAQLDKMKKGPCPYCGAGINFMRTPGEAQGLFYCRYCNRPIIYDHPSGRFYAFLGH